MQFVLHFMRVSKSKSWKWWNWVAFAYNLGQEKVIFLLILWENLLLEVVRSIQKNHEIGSHVLKVELKWQWSTNRIRV
jgi:hypothetical protein